MVVVNIFTISIIIIITTHISSSFIIFVIPSLIFALLSYHYFYHKDYCNHYRS